MAVDVAWAAVAGALAVAGAVVVADVEWAVEAEEAAGADQGNRLSGPRPVLPDRRIRPSGRAAPALGWPLPKPRAARSGHRATKPVQARTGSPLPDRR